MKNIILTAIICTGYILNLHAQRTTDEQPFGLQDSFRTKAQNIIVLTAPDRVRIEKEDSINDQQPGPVRYAYPILVNYTLENSGVWQQLADGGKVWRLKVNIPEALSTNTYYDKFWLPEGAKFFVYSENTKQSIGAVTSDFIEGSREKPVEFATSLIYGENVVYEYYQPASIKESPVIIISRIDYGYRYVDNPYNTLRNFGNAGSCQVNINCTEGSAWQDEKHAIARVSIPLSDEAGSGWCSCALVNNIKKNNTPYVLIANHCLQDPYSDYAYDAINNPTGSGFIFYWEYEQPGCANSYIEPIIRSTTGATVVANNNVTDFALLLLNATQDPRYLTGVTPYYLGWDRTGNSVMGGVGIHHPRGDVKKIAIYAMSPVDSYCANSDLFWDVSFISTANGHSVMEPGSSGSPLINNRRIIGQLYGPYNLSRCPAYQCNNPSLQQVAYGKFSVSWTGNGATDNRRKLQPWLDPTNTNDTILNGIAVHPLVNFTNRTVTSNTFVSSRGDINVENVQVKNGAQLTFYTAGKVNIIRNFDVELGSSFKIIIY